MIIQLVRKDIIMHYKQMLQHFLFIIGMIVLWYYTKTSIMMMYLFATFISANALTMKNLGEEDKNDVTKFLMTLPITRRELIASKYTTSLLFMVVGSVIPLIFVGTLDFFVNGFVDPPWKMLFFSYIGNLVNIAIMLGVYYRFGAKKVRYIFVGFIIIMVAVVIFMQQANTLAQLIHWYSHANQVLYGIFAVISSAILFCFSLQASQKYFAKKEL